MTTVAPHPDLEVRGTKGSGAGRRLHALRSFAPGELITAFKDPILGELMPAPAHTSSKAQTWGLYTDNNKLTTASCDF